MLKEYHKIETIYKRDDKTKKLNENEFRNEAVEFLKNNEWEFTEKIEAAFAGTDLSYRIDPADRRKLHRPQNPW